MGLGRVGVVGLEWEGGGRDIMVRKGLGVVW